MSNNSNVFVWDPVSAGRKFYNDSTITVSTGVVSVSKDTPKHNPEKDAYRNCANCGRHINYHTNGQCPCKKK